MCSADLWNGSALQGPRLRKTRLRKQLVTSLGAKLVDREPLNPPHVVKNLGPYTQSLLKLNSRETGLRNTSIAKNKLK